MSRRPVQSGYALIAVLWTTALLSLIAASMIAQSRIAVRIERNESRRLELQTLAEAATNRAVLGLLSKGGGDVALLSGAPTVYEVAGLVVETSIQDETGKADLNEVDQGTLDALLKAAGAAPDRSALIAAEIIAWRDPQRSQTDELVGPRQFRRFQSIDELRLVPGMDEALFKKLRPGVTVYSQTASITPDVAPEFVLRAFLPNENARVDALLKARSLKADVAVAQGRIQSGDLSMLNGRAFAISVTIPDGERRRTFNTVVRISGDKQRPFWVLSRAEF